MSTLTSKDPVQRTQDMHAAADAVRETARLAYSAGEVPRRDGSMQPIAPAGMSQNGAEALCNFALQQGAVRTIETGLGIGLSALALGEAAMRSGNSAALHTAIDPSAHWAGYAGLDLVRKTPLVAHFRFFSEPSQIVLPRLIASGERFDIALVDGAHWFEAALMDLYFMMQLVPERGLVIVDDIWMAPVRLAIEYALTNLGCELVPSPHQRFAVLTRPERFPPKREWDAFTPFADPGRERFTQ